MAEGIHEIKYRNYTIKAIPARDPDGGGWIAQFIPLKHEGEVTRGNVVKDQSHVCEDRGEAIKRSLSMGKVWVDRKEGPP